MNELPICAALFAKRLAMLMCAAAAMLGGCGEPKCPQGSEKIGSQCRPVNQHDDDPSTATDSGAEGDGNGGGANNGSDAEANGGNGADANGVGPEDSGSGPDQDDGGTGTMCSIELCNAQDDDCDTVVDESCMDIDDCASLPCKNGGMCTDGQGTFECTCAPGFEGNTCETNINECAPNPCLNGGRCSDGANTFMCTCTAGYQGERCEIANDDCDPNPCRNGGTCEDLAMGGVKCTCSAGYSGAQCEVNINECAPNPCMNGGTCADGINKYTCTCPAGYSGAKCETNINDCSPNPCMNGGACKDGVNTHTCTCPAGYSGANCETNINDCSPNPCQNGGTCMDGINMHTCACPTGTKGANCELKVCGDVTIRSRADIDTHRMCAEINNLSIATAGFLEITANDFPYLSKVTGQLKMDSGFTPGPSGEVVQSVTFSALQTVGGALGFLSAQVKEIHFPILREVGEWSFFALPVRVLDFPALTTIHGLAAIQVAPALCTAHVSKVTKVGGNAVFASLPKLHWPSIQPLAAASAASGAGSQTVDAVGCCYPASGQSCGSTPPDPNGPDCKCE